MRIEDRYGLTLAWIAPDELTEEPWRGEAGHVDVVRLPAPLPANTAALAERGFVRKPATVSWIAELARDEDEFLSGLMTKPRQDVRRAQRRAADAGLCEVLEEPVRAETLDCFLALYESRVARMRFGVPFARDYREAVLDGPQKFFGVFSWAGDELVGGCLVLERPEVDAAVLRFSVVSAPWRRASLARVLYLSAMRAARERGYTRVTLGNEPNLLGHLTQPGLLVFKSQLGFRAVPAQDFGDPDLTDEADLVLSLKALSDPVLVLGYATDVQRDRTLEAHVICEAPVEPARYAAPFLGSVTVRAPGSTEVRTVWSRDRG